MYEALRLEFVKPLVVLCGLYKNVSNSLWDLDVKSCPFLPVVSPRFLPPGRIRLDQIVA